MISAIKISPKWNPKDISDWIELEPQPAAMFIKKLQSYMGPHFEIVRIKGNYRTIVSDWLYILNMKN